MTNRDELRLIGIHPKLRAAVEVILIRMVHNSTQMFVVEGVRTAERQAELYAQGRTTPGPIVTMRDGVKLKSAHQVHPDSFGYAVDLAFTGPAPFSPDNPWDFFGETAESLGLTWGGRWIHPNPVDKPHIELPIIIQEAGKHV